jgi:NADPH:quinone reductase-like Zn-dependent oxidoreductase
LVLFKHLTLYGFLTESAMCDTGATRDVLAAVYDELACLVTRGNLKSHIGAVYSLDEIGDAVDAVTQGFVGKVVVVP